MFTPSHAPGALRSDADIIIGLRGHDLLVTAGDAQPALPQRHDLGDVAQDPSAAVYLGTLGSRACYALPLDAGTPLPPTLALRPLRDLLTTAPTDMVHAGLLGLHLLPWHRATRFCGACGSATQPKADERAKQCPACGQLVFPRISPAVIVAVLRDGKLLLATNRRFKGKMFSLVAGFVEPAESLEDTVRREVREETGLEVDGLNYFGSQPWPFPDSLMIGFTARWAGGELRLDGQELVDGGWYEAGALPPIPPPGSISRRIIDWFVERSSPHAV